MKIVKHYHLHNFIIVALICMATTLFAQDIILPDMGVCAHRGAMDTYPENTIPAFEEAIRLGVQMIELDVRLTKDKYLVIIHDETVDRTTGGSGKIEDLTLSDIRSLDAGSWKSSEFKNIMVPTFSEALLIMPKNIWLNVHLKGEEELGRKVAIEILEQNRAHQAFLACGSAAAAGARSVSTDIMICNMERQTKTDDYVDQTIAKKNQFIQLYKLPANKKIKSYTTRLKENGIKINYCCTDSPKEVKKLHKYGVDFVLVNKPESVLENINLVDR